MTSLALLLIGFSIFSAVTLALTHFRKENYRDQAAARITGLMLLFVLGGLQLAHFEWLYFGYAWVDSAAYRMLLFSVAPIFYLFSQPLLNPRHAPNSIWSVFWHALPVLISPWLLVKTALPAAFIVGAGYLLSLARSLYMLRNERANFRLELMLLGAVFVIAIVVAILAQFQAALPENLFLSLYAVSIGAAFLLVQIALGLRPELSVEVSELVRESYTSSTLINVDCDAVLLRLSVLMQQDRIYEDDGLTLPKLAKKLQITSHQLSELVNVRLGKGFSRYLREQRIEAAKIVLLAQPTASILSVGLGVGFTSQSSFYEAFREIEGMTPGQFRKMHIRDTSSR